MSRWWELGQSAYRAMMLLMVLVVVLQLSEVIVLLTRVLEEGK